eukprot:5201259-Prymnesium_polylepis.1
MRRSRRPDRCTRHRGGHRGGKGKLGPRRGTQGGCGRGVWHTWVARASKRVAHVRMGKLGPRRGTHGRPKGQPSVRHTWGWRRRCSTQGGKGQPGPRASRTSEPCKRGGEAADVCEGGEVQMQPEDCRVARRRREGRGGRRAGARGPSGDIERAAAARAREAVCGGAADAARAPARPRGRAEHARGKGASKGRDAAALAVGALRVRDGLVVRRAVRLRIVAEGGAAGGGEAVEDRFTDARLLLDHARQVGRRQGDRQQ